MGSEETRSSAREMRLGVEMMLGFDGFFMLLKLARFRAEVNLFRHPKPRIFFSRAGLTFEVGVFASGF